MNEFNDYVIAQFSAGVTHLCKAPFASMIKEGDLVVVDGYGKGTVLAVETANGSNNLLELLAKIDYDIFRINAVYSKREIKWGTDDE